MTTMYVVLLQQLSVGDLPTVSELKERPKMA